MLIREGMEIVRELDCRLEGGKRRPLDLMKDIWMRDGGRGAVQVFRRCVCVESFEERKQKGTERNRGKEEGRENSQNDQKANMLNPK